MKFKPGGCLAGAAFPFLGLLAWGCLFDSRGGEPFSATVMSLIVLFPQSILVAAFIYIVYTDGGLGKKAIIFANCLLFATIVISSVLVRRENALKQIQETEQLSGKIR